MTVRQFSTNYTIRTTLATVCQRTANRKTNAYAYDQDDAERFSQKRCGCMYA
jgi:hypothetical protein